VKAVRNRAAWGAFVLLCLAVVIAAGGVEWAARQPAAAPDIVAATPTPTVTPTPDATPTATPTPGDAAMLAAPDTLFREGRFDEARAAFEAAARATGDLPTAAEAWFGAGRAAEALGDGAGAVAAFEAAASAAPDGSPTAARATYRWLRALNDAGQFAEAAAVPRLPGRGPVESYARFERGRALAGVGDAAGAATEWQALANDATLIVALRGRALDGLARLARDAGDAPARARWLDARIALDGNPAARYERALLARDLGDMATFARLLTDLVMATPLAAQSTLAIAELDAAGIAVDPGQVGFILYRRGANAEVVRVLSAAVEEPGISPAARTFRAFYLAAAYEELGRIGTAIAWYDVAAGTGAASPFVHRARYWAARALENAGRNLEAAARYQALVVEGPAGEFTAESAFRAGYARYIEGDIPGALAAWEATEAAASPRLEYWRGRALEDAGRAEEAEAAYRRAVELHRFDIFALEATARLGEPILSLEVGYRPRDLGRGVDWEAIAAWLRAEIGGDWTGAGPTGACELARAGLDAEATAELEAAANGARAWRLLELAREAHTCGLTRTALRLALRVQQATGVARYEAPPDLLRVVYPVDYGAALDRAARAHGVDPLFFAALIRAESLWDPRAESHAGALGLTQVMPATGEGIAAALGRDGFETAHLFRPAVALEFGVYYLGVQLRRFDDPLLALAAYNAGPGNALRWAAAGDVAAAGLVERIDFRETQGYVRVVVEAYAYYVLAWGP
jgi:soluble lytic murein transglycosylase